MSYTSHDEFIWSDAVHDLDNKAVIIAKWATRKMMITGLGVAVRDAIVGAPQIRIRGGGVTKRYRFFTGTGAYYLRWEGMILEPGQQVTVDITTAATAESGDSTAFELFARLHPPAYEDEGVTIL